VGSPGRRMPRRWGHAHLLLQLLLLLAWVRLHRRRESVHGARLSGWHPGAIHHLHALLLLEMEVVHHPRVYPAAAHHPGMLLHRYPTGALLLVSHSGMTLTRPHLTLTLTRPHLWILWMGARARGS
jgi:hypothetical protein